METAYENGTMSVHHQSTAEIGCADLAALCCQAAKALSLLTSEMQCAIGPPGVAASAAAGAPAVQRTQRVESVMLVLLLRLSSTASMAR